MEEVQLDAFRRQPTWLVNQVGFVSKRLLTSAFGGMGVRGYHYLLVSALREHGPASQIELATRTGIDRSDVVAAINALADAGVVERTPDPADRRRNIITLTPTGRERLKALDAVVDDVQRDFVAPLDDAEQQELIRLLTKLLDHHRGES